MKKSTTFIDPTTDFGFKRIFGTDANKDLLLAFLNQLFCGRKTITDLYYNKNEHVGDTEEIGSVIFDLTCTADNGEQFIIEVQRTLQGNLKKRIIYYGCKLVSDQAPKGGRRNWNYNISEVYVIVFMDGFHMADGDCNNFLHEVCLCYKNTGKVFYADLEYIYLELVNFTKEESDLQNDLERWLFVMKNMSSMDKLSKYLSQPIFKKLFQVAEYSKLSKKEKEMYDASLKRKWDAEAVRQYLEDQAQQIEDARNQVEEERKKADDAQKKAEDALKAAEDAQREERANSEITVRNLIEVLGLADNVIVRIANVSLEFVQEIRTTLGEKK